MGRRRIQCSRDYEERIQAAIRGVTEGQYKSYAEAALDLKTHRIIHSIQVDTSLLTLDKLCTTIVLIVSSVFSCARPIVTSDSRGTPNYGGGIVPSVGVKIRKHPRPYVVRSHHCETWEPAALT
ncbi:hypothetical protein E4T56_gene2955 [Termitomyces sp. T112]|nr:hypothetical protein E4T56_gene2955 [Termitomyces sp. T112]